MHNIFERRTKLDRQYRFLTMALVLLCPLAAHAADVATELKDQDDQVLGQVEVTEIESGVLIKAMIENLPPGTHAFHIHETGECDPATEFKSAGGHLNNGSEHGFMNEGGPHPGDMPNIHVPESGRLVIEIVNERVQIESGDLTALQDEDGAAMVVHNGADDYVSEPAGDAGDRIACAVLFEPQ